MRFGCKLFDLYLFEIRDKLEHNCSARKKQRAAVALITSDIEKKIYETATAERKQELHALRNKWALADDALKETGVYEKALEQYLEEIHVVRQAYYSGVFVGNHVYKCLKQFKEISQVRAWPGTRACSRLARFFCGVGARFHGCAHVFARLW